MALLRLCCMSALSTIEMSFIVPSLNKILMRSSSGLYVVLLVVPVKAVIHDEENDTYSVTLIDRDSIAYTVNVNPGIKRDSLEEIHSQNLKAGMKVIVEGNYGLPDSTKVSIKK